MNPIVEKFNKTNPNYNLVVSEYEPEGHYQLRNKQGELCPELDLGSYGYNISKVMPFVWKLFNECFGEGIKGRVIGAHRDWDTYVLWEYEDYLLELREENEHPRTGGVYMRIRIYPPDK